MTTLNSLVVGARDANGADRIEYRDAIAAYGIEGLHAVLPWALEEHGGLAWFAVAVIAAAVPSADPSVVADALKRISAEGVDAGAREDAAAALGGSAPTK